MFTNVTKHASTLSIAVSLLLLGVTYSAAEARNGFDLSNAAIPVEEIHSGGPPKDGIPAIDRPRFVSADGAHFLKDKDRVIGVLRNGVVKAYPIAILNWHEIVNDRFSGESVVVSFCPLCGTGLAFSTQGREARTFGVSGLLYNSDLLLYDRETESLWSQISAHAVTGKLKGERLNVIPIAHTSWSAWRQRHPQTEVLSRQTGYSRDYDRDPYAGYETSDGIFFPVKHIDRRYHPKERVVGVEIDGHYKVYPFAELSKARGEVIDKVATKRLRIVFDADNQSATILSDQGKPFPSLTGFWFAWMAFHPESEVYIAK